MVVSYKHIHFLKRQNHILSGFLIEMLSLVSLLRLFFIFFSFSFLSRMFDVAESKNESDVEVKSSETLHKHDTQLQ